MARHVFDCHLRWGDMDAYGHVNNVAFLSYLEEARVDMLFVHARDHGAERLAEGVIVVRHEIDYRRPLAFRPEPVRIETWVTAIGQCVLSAGVRRPRPGRDLRHGGDDARAVRPRAAAPAPAVAQEKAVLARYLDDDASSAGTR